MPKKKIKKVPRFESEKEERNFWSKHEVFDYFDVNKQIKLDISKLKPSTQTVTIRMPKGMVEDLKVIANKKDVPYQSLVKIVLAEKIRDEKNLSA